MSVIEEERVRGGVFKDINAEDDDVQPTVIESLCMNCYKNVNTFILNFVVVYTVVWCHI